MESKKDVNIRKNFFKNLKLRRGNVRKFKGQDKIGFKLEDGLNEYRIFTIRQEGERKDHWYSTTIFNGPEPKDILVQTRIYGFEKSIKTHYSALDYLRKI